MGQVIVATRYAKSLLHLAAEQGIERAIYDDMKLISATCDDSHELDLLLKSPIVKAEKKVSILDDLFKSKVNELSIGFIDIITKNKREGLLYEIAVAYKTLFKIKNDIITATVTTAIGLDAEMKSDVLKLIKGSADSEVELIERTDEEIIGGIIVRIGDEQYDASLQRRLNDLKQEFGRNYIAN